MDPAQLVLDYIYKYFGLTAKFRVFSGRRGFHDYLINKRMIYMTAAQRASFLHSIQWENMVPGTDIHDDIFRILQPFFDANPVLSARFVPPPNVSSDSPIYKDAYRQTIFNHLYPKIDGPVLVNPTHLHKLPLTLHPETGKSYVFLFYILKSKKVTCVW
jgi:DNA primase catalytic subunit